MIDEIIRWIDHDIERYPLAQLPPYVGLLGMAPGVLTSWTALTMTVAFMWGLPWGALWLWRMVVHAQRETEKNRQRHKRRAAREAKARAAKRD